MPGRVLIVDDDMDTCGLLWVYLTGLGYEAEVRSSGTEAIDAFRADAFDVVITDILMPQMDGLEVLRTLKQIDPEVGVIVFSGAIEDRTRIAIDALRGGAADYFIKPIADLADLERAVARATALRASRREETSHVRELERRARTDSLTGLANRSELEQRLVEEFSRLGRGVDELALAIFDVDAFKAINDAHGHLVGDQVLRAVAGAVRDNCRAYDVKARYGGDEFVVVMPETSLEQGIAVTEKIRRAVSSLAPASGMSSLRVMLSAGVTSTSPREGLTPEGLVRRADQALYEAKAAGRNKVVPLPQGPPAAEVLLVVADTDEATSLIGLCESLGISAEWVREGAEAIERARSSRFALVLVDGALASPPAAETIQGLKAISPTPSTVLVTGDDAEGPAVAEAIARFPLTVARKPLSSGHLRTLLSEARRRT